MMKNFYGTMTMNRIALTTSLLIILLLGGCDTFSSVDDSDGEGSDINRQQLRELSASEQIMVEGTNDFAFNLLHKLNEKEQGHSYFVSPLSISTAFSMAINGARGETFEQMRDFFGYSELNLEEINRANRELIDLLTQLDPKVVMNIANSIWYRQGVSVKPEFLDNNREYFGAEVEEMDFSDPGAPDIINAWIEESTEGMIEEMIDQIDGDVIMFLINAIYFNGDWTIQFDPEKTREEPFYLQDGSTMNVPLMRARDEFRTYRDERWTALDLWYGETGFSFTALLPNGDGDLTERVADLTAERFAAITDQLSEETVDIYVPRFELEYEIEDFPGDLIDMGLTLPFGSGADFTGIADLALEISDVMHKAVIELDETGSEAAAATVIEIRETSAGGDQIGSIRLDRPFLFFIRENSSNTILFMGSYTGLAE